MCKMTGDTNAEADQEEIHERLTALLEHASNRVCADCPERNPGLISLLQKPLVENGSNLGVFCCSKCSRAHRKLGENVVVVKRVYDDFALNEIQALEQSGNHFVNNILEANATDVDKSEDREVFIRKKYGETAFFSEDKLYQESAVRAKANKYSMLLVKPTAAPSRADRLLKRAGSNPNLMVADGGLSRTGSSRNLMGKRASSSRDLMGTADWGSKADSKWNLLATDEYRRSSMPMKSTIDSDDENDGSRPVERKRSSASSPKRQRPPRSFTEGGDSSEGVLQRMAMERRGSRRDIMGAERSSSRRDLLAVTKSSRDSSEGVLQRIAMGKAGSRRDLMAGQRSSSRRDLLAGTKSSGDSSEAVLQRMTMGRAGSRRDLMADQRSSSRRDLVVCDRSLSKRDLLASGRCPSKRDVRSSGKSLSKRDLDSSGKASSSPSLTSLARPSGSKWGMVKSNLLNQASRNSLLTAYQDTDSDSEDETKCTTGKYSSAGNLQLVGAKKESTKRLSGKWNLLKQSLNSKDQRKSLLLSYSNEDGTDSDSEDPNCKSTTEELSKGSKHLSRSSSKGDLSKGSKHVSRAASKVDLSKGSKHLSRSSSKEELSRGSKHLPRTASKGEMSKRSHHRSKSSTNNLDETKLQCRDSASKNVKKYKDDAASPRSPLDAELANHENKAMDTLANDHTSKKDRLKAITDNPENTLCSECTNKNPTWASFFKSPVDNKKLGVLCCYFCYGLHHTVGEGEMTLKNVGEFEQWSESDFEALELSGNTLIKASYEATVGNAKTTDFNHDQGREAFFFEKYVNLRYFSGEVYRQLSAHAVAKSLAAKMESLGKVQEQQRQDHYEERRANRRSSNENDVKTASTSPSDGKSKKKRPKKQDDDKKRQAILELKAARKHLEEQQAREAQEEELVKKESSNMRLDKLDRPESQEKSTRKSSSSSRLDKTDRLEKREMSMRKSSSRRSLFDDACDGDKPVRKSETKEEIRQSSSRQSLFDDDGDGNKSARKPDTKEKSMRKSSSRRSIFDEDRENDKSIRKSSSRRDLLQKQESRRLTRRGSSSRSLMEDSSTDDETDNFFLRKNEQDRSARKSLRKSSSGRDLHRSSSRRDLF